jgi:hypothetical protein
MSNISCSDIKWPCCSEHFILSEKKEIRNVCITFRMKVIDLWAIYNEYKNKKMSYHVTERMSAICATRVKAASLKMN